MLIDIEKLDSKTCTSLFKKGYAYVLEELEDFADKKSYTAFRDWSSARDAFEELESQLCPYDSTRITVIDLTTQETCLSA